MKLMKKAVALVLMSLLVASLTACDQKKEKAEVAPAVEHAAPAVEQPAPAAEQAAPAVEAPAPETAPAAEGQQPMEVPSPDQPQEGQPAPAAEGGSAPASH